MIKSLGTSMLITSIYIIALIILGAIVFVAATNAHVIWQVETAVGHPITCSEAYEYRQIDAYFYPTRSLQGDALYLFSLGAPCIFVGFFMLIVALASTSLSKNFSIHFKRAKTLLMGLGVMFFFALLAYSPIIYLIGCATE